ncbi:unnamed protein product [Zymoseptoria tritici ST99CH_1E4]|uniref:Nucleolar pre-ribosomal-associated protein 1 N-terminal domain-containing protein n=1 Tax=Zymoseptoria tritici ST99CH_1E4 TaxID=1276532 RepID=A0A2H1GY72_ZYMTR|nr:unnamed protein product [Zymoseptoria tritici ST99CH_1E4]
MSKRERQPLEEGTDRPPKRARPDFQPPAIEEIHFARQLQDTLVFRQDGLHQLRNGLASFKNFLESILYHREPELRARQLSILREYLQTQTPADANDYDHPLLGQLWQAWSFANQNNNDHLAASIAAIFALLLKTLSGILDLRDQGLLLCRTVLQGQHLRLLKRALEAPKHKDFVISPALRLLSEVVGFDGGVLARDVYGKREMVFDGQVVKRNLGLVKVDMSEEDAKRRPSIRTLTMRLVLSLLKYLHEGGKMDILKNRPLCGALFQHLRDDPAELVTELLTTVETNVLKDGELPRSSKAAILSSQNLERVTEIAARSGEEHAAREKAFAWLKAVCTKPEYGVLRESGWYPPGTTSSDAAASASIDLGLDSIEFYDSGELLNIRNTTLLSWTATLRANSDERERDLLLLCFKSAPELVAAYFAERTMQMDPKLTNTWIGYASLLFEIVALPVPAHLGNEDSRAELPAQTSIMIENIVPRPLNQKVLVKCLHQSNDLITFFAIRFLVLAFQKLASVIAEMQPQASSNTLWREAESRLRQRFASRCPPMKEIIATYRKIPDDYEHAMQREAATRLLWLYYELLPLQALEEQFDVSTTLTSALVASETPAARVPAELQALRNLELEHLLAVARYSTGMKWFHKQGGLSYTPIVTLLRIHRKEPRDRTMRGLLEHVLVENNVLSVNATSEHETTTLDVLMASLLPLEDASPVWEFLDDLIGRATRKPVKYLDDLDGISKERDETSLLVAVMLEQASFVAKDSGAEGTAKAEWIEEFLALLGKHTAEDARVLKHITKRIRALSGWKAKKAKHESATYLEAVTLPPTSASADETSLAEPPKPTESTLPYPSTPREPDSHPELTRWSLKDLDLALTEGDISSLLLCLSSQHPSIRAQAVTQLRKLHYSLPAYPNLPSVQQLTLLIGEVLETFAQQYTKSGVPMPYLATCFAGRAVDVLGNPASVIYPKLNRYLIRGPEWRVGKMPGYWLSNTLTSLPEEDDGYWKEVQWVLDWLVDGLRSVEDLEILRRGGTFEKVFALSGCSPGVRKSVREKVGELVYRAGCLEGGAEVLVKRTGVLSWLEGVGEVERALREWLVGRCEGGGVGEWSGGIVGGTKKEADE